MFLRKNHSIFQGFLITAIFLTTESIAHERFRPRSLEQLGSEITSNPCVRVVGTKVSYANYAAIRRDFPELMNANLSNTQIDQWLLQNFAYISQEQLRLSGIRQTEIPVDLNDTKNDYRPPRYRRAGILEAKLNGKTIGLVDTKGIGHSQHNQSDLNLPSTQDPKSVHTQLMLFEKARGNEQALDELRILDHVLTHVPSQP